MKADFVERKTQTPNAFTRGTLYYLYDSCVPTNSRLRFEYNLPSGITVSNLYHYGDGALYSMCTSKCTGVNMSEMADPWWANSTIYIRDEQDMSTGLFWYSRKTLTATSQVSRILMSVESDPASSEYSVKKIEFSDGRMVTLSNVVVNPIGMNSGDSKFDFDSLSCPKAVCPIFADMVFVMDYSGSISTSEWNQASKFVTSVMNSFTFGGDGVAASVVQFNAPSSAYSHGTKYVSGCGNRYTADCTFGSRTATSYTIPNSRTASVLAGASVSGSSIMTVSTNKASLISEMAKKRTPSGNTCQGFGLELAMKVLDLSPRKNSANKPSNIVIAVTDGVDMCPNRTAAATAKLKNVYNAFVVEIGVGMSNCKSDKEFLQRIASSFGSSLSKAYFDVSDYAAIEMISDYVSNLICGDQTSECDSGCNGFCGCGDCFTPEYDPSSSSPADESSEQVLPSSSFVAPAQPSEPSHPSCPAGEYMSPLTNSCVKCTSVLKCATCSSSSTCDSCLEGYVLKSSACVLDCESLHGAGCERCTEKKCMNCTESECCKRKKYYWDNVDHICMDPALKFGEGCLESDGERCTKCTSQRCCGSNEYYDYDRVACRPCTDYGDKCEVCDRSQCLRCGNENEDSVTVDWDGNCVSCEDLFGSGCLSCTETECKATKDGYVKLGDISVGCNELFGACDKCVSSGCVDCDTGFQRVNGYCRKCSDMFGDMCTSCNSSRCLACADGALLVNGACVETCEMAFGKGCIECSNSSCLRAADGFFVSAGYSFKCDVLSGEVLEKCLGNSTLASRGAMKRDSEVGEFISVAFDAESFSVSCADMTDNCMLCSVKNSQASCTLCQPGYVLVGGVCKSCSEHIPDGECLECSLTGCTKCFSDEIEILANGNCASCGNGFVFDDSSKSCVSCSALYGLCADCNEKECTACQEPSAILVGNKCVPCKDVYGQGCTECNSNACLACSDEKCCAEGEKIVYVDGASKCGTCKAFDDSCSECTVFGCVKCENGMVVDPNTNKCTPCEELFEGCSECSSDVCEACSNPKWKLTENGCYDPELSSPSYVPLNETSETGSQESKINIGLVVVIAIGCLLAVAVVCIIAFKATNRNSNLAHRELVEEEFAAELDLL